MRVILDQGWRVHADPDALDELIGANEAPLPTTSRRA
jgi:hypothetical protein